MTVNRSRRKHIFACPAFVARVARWAKTYKIAGAKMRRRLKKKITTEEFYRLNYQAKSAAENLIVSRLRCNYRF